MIDNQVIFLVCLEVIEYVDYAAVRSRAFICSSSFRMLVKDCVRELKKALLNNSRIFFAVEPTITKIWIPSSSSTMTNPSVALQVPATRH